MFARYHSGRRRPPSENFYCKDFSDIDFLYPTIGIFCLCPIETQKPKTIRYRWWQDRADGSRVKQRLSLIPMYLAGIELAETSEYCNTVVGQSDLNMDLAHHNLLCNRRRFLEKG